MFTKTSQNYLCVVGGSAKSEINPNPILFNCFLVPLLSFNQNILKLNKFYGAAIGAYVIWGFIPLPLKALTDYPSSQILYYRILFSVMILIALNLIFRRDSVMALFDHYKAGATKEKRTFIILTIASGMLLLVNWFVFIYVVNHINVQTGSFSYLICPILTALLGFLLLKEKLKSNQWIAIFISFLSCCLVGTGSLMHLLFSLLIATSYALFLITQRVLRNYDKITMMMLQLSVSALFLIPFHNYFNAEHPLGADMYFFGVISILSLAFTVIPLFLSMYALKDLKSGTMGILMYINPIINFLLAFFYFNEVSSSSKAIAYSLIFLSVVIYNLKFKKKRKILPAE
ncbi:EamA family transporter [Adhaeribacter aquaticus]|uniref:EamA family transporter n=1 Tax=Adhaeribacter aquaticus TaxID=299567 RepID=UPI0004138596|nr:EamA family transporter [Adhaeribacter aquaticus]